MYHNKGRGFFCFKGFYLFLSVFIFSPVGVLNDGFFFYLLGFFFFLVLRFLFFPRRFFFCPSGGAGKGKKPFWHGKVLFFALAPWTRQKKSPHPVWEGFFFASHPKPTRLVPQPKLAWQRRESSRKVRQKKNLTVLFFTPLFLLPVVLLICQNHWNLLIFSGNLSKLKET